MLSNSNSLPISKSWSPQKFGGILVTVLHVNVEKHENVEKHVSTPLSSSFPGPLGRTRPP